MGEKREKVGHNMDLEFHRQDLPFLGRDATIDEKVEWKRREDVRELAFQGSRALHNVERQRNHAHQMRLHHSPCWLCGFPVSEYSGARSIDIEIPYPVFRCVQCGVRMHYFMPLVAFGPSWYWSRPQDMTLTEVIETVEATRSVWEKYETQSAG